MKANPSHERIEELVVKAADGEALDWEKELVAGHLRGCSSCAELQRGLSDVGVLLRRDVAAAVADADFSGMMSRIDAGIDRAAAERDRERVRRLFFSWSAVSRWGATAAVAAAFAWAVLLPSGAPHDYTGADNRVQVSSVEGGKNNTVMIYESEEDNVTFIWVIEEERAL